MRFVWLASKGPASAASSPEMAKTRTFVLATSTPEYQAATLLAPV
jgi:hypothetical protein